MITVPVTYVIENLMSYYMKNSTRLIVSAVYNCYYYYYYYNKKSKASYYFTKHLIHDHCSAIPSSLSSFNL